MNVASSVVCGASNGAGIVEETCCVVLAPVWTSFCQESWKIKTITSHARIAITRHVQMCFQATLGTRHTSIESAPV